VPNVADQTSSGRGSPRVLFLRVGDYAITPAIPRFIGALRAVRPSAEIRVICWNVSGKVDGGQTLADGTVVLRSTFAPGRTTASKFLGMLRWWCTALVTIWRFRPDLVHASDVWCHVPCLVARVLRQFAFIADVRDPVVAQDSGPAALRGVLRLTEWVCLRVADYVTVVETNRLQFVPARAVTGGRALVVRNLPETDLGFQQPDPEADTRVLLALVGYLSEIRGLRALARLLEADHDVEVLVASAWSQRVNHLVEVAPKRVHVQGWVSHNQALSLMARADIVVLLYDPHVLANQIAAPNKFYEALMLGRPCLVAEGTPMSELCGRSACGYVVEYDNDLQIANVVNAVRSDRAEWLRTCLRARSTFENNYDWLQERKGLERVYERTLP
jgi:glycosyltransferase involved in cell wall biosynthesis